MHTPDDIRRAIRREFKFLVDLYGFKEVPPSPPSDDMYSEVQFEKGKWRISILTIAHETRVNVEIVSPENNRGSLLFLIDSENEKSKRANFETNVFGDIQYHAQHLKTYEKLLTGNNKDFENTLEILIEKQRKWLVESGIMSEAELARWEQQQKEDNG